MPYIPNKRFRWKLRSAPFNPLLKTAIGMTYIRLSNKLHNSTLLRVIISLPVCKTLSKHLAMSE